MISHKRIKSDSRKYLFMYIKKKMEALQELQKDLNASFKFPLSIRKIFLLDFFSDTCKDVKKV